MCWILIKTYSPEIIGNFLFVILEAFGSFSGSQLSYTKSKSTDNAVHAKGSLVTTIETSEQIIGDK